MKNKVVVFDLDDTLYQELDFLKSGYRFVAAKVGHPEAYQEMLKWYGNGDNAFQKLLDQYLVSDYSLPQLLDFYHFHQPQIELKPSVWDTLVSLSEKAVLGIVSDGRTETQWNKIQALHLTDIMPRENVLISEEVGYGKPDARLFSFFEEKYPDHEYYYIGDNLKKDFITPNERGWKSICLLDKGENIHAQDFEAYEEKYLPQVRIADFNSLLNYV